MIIIDMTPNLCGCGLMVMIQAIEQKHMKTFQI